MKRTALIAAIIGTLAAPCAFAQYAQKVGELQILNGRVLWKEGPGSLTSVVSPASWCAALASTSHTLRLSCNGGAYKDLVTVGGTGVGASGLWITADPADLVFEKSGTTAKGRITASVTSGVEDIWRTSNASQNAGGATWSRDDTGKVAWLDGISASGDAWLIKRAAAAANPITWVTLATLSNGGVLDTFGGYKAGNWEAVTYSGTNLIFGANAGWTTVNFPNGNVRIGSASAPSARLHVGASGTNTTAEEIRIDAPSGSGGHALLTHYRNGALKTTWGTAGAAGAGVAGSNANDAYISNVQAILESCDGGTTLHRKLDSSGNQTITGSYKERSRTTAMGEWTTFTPTLSSSSGTFTGGSNSGAYTLVGKTMIVSVEINSASVTGTPARLRVDIPGSFTSARTQSTGAGYVDNATPGNGVAWVTGAGGTRIEVVKDRTTTNNFAASTSNTGFGFTLSFEIQ